MRPAEPSDLPFLRAMLYEAAFWPPGGPRPPLDQALAEPALARYVAGWGRAGDAGVIALGDEGKPVGAAWYRLFPPDEPGFGFVDGRTPELSLAVVAQARGRGVGSTLLGGLLARARADGYEALSLSVEPDNPARRLYERHDFVRVGGEAAWTMRQPAPLTPPATSGVRPRACPLGARPGSTGRGPRGRTPRSAGGARRTRVGRAR
jgi:ribosomal protein S18 acetylase RimI-like enzyme